MDMEEQGETDYRGTIVHFTPDAQIFTETTEFDFDTLRTRTRELAFLNRGLTISIEDKREEHKVRKDFHYEGGIRSYVEHLNKAKTLSMSHQFIWKVNAMILWLRFPCNIILVLKQHHFIRK